ncbi:MAG: FAD/NAD(P)-binding protein [Leucobacter sp.]
MRPAIPQPRSSNLTTPDPAAIAIVGAGPRGTSLIERLGANLRDPALTGNRRADQPLTLHVIDDAQSGAGRVWRTDQPRELCMNTLSHAVTLFTERGSTVAGPIVPGPTLYEWSVLALHSAFPSAATTRAVAEVTSEHVATCDSFATRDGLAADYRDELERTVPETHPSRALYGEYLAWCYDRAVAALPAGVRVIRHLTRAIGTARQNGREVVTLASGERVEADAVILATGWMPRSETASERDLGRALERRPELGWVRPASPVDQRLTDIAPGSHAIVRGLGMGFFDTVALLTIERGGKFVPDPEAASGLRYVTSGLEPVLHATSNRGVPFRAKSLYRSLPPRPAQRFALGVDWSTVPRPIDFDRRLWPRIVADAFLDHAETLVRVRPEAVAGSAAELRAAISAALDTALDASLDTALAEANAAAAAPEFLEETVRVVAAAVAPLIPDPTDRFDLLGEMRPVRRAFSSPAEFDAWVAERVTRDLREAELGRDSAVKAGLWSISAARGLANRVGALGGFDAESRASGHALLGALGGMVGSGPPAFRSRQLLALADAGLVHFFGPAAEVRVEDAGFAAESPWVSGSRVVAPSLVDAWMRFHDVSETVDPLARELLDADRARAFRVASRTGGAVPTGAFDVDFASGRLIGGDGKSSGGESGSGSNHDVRNGSGDDGPRQRLDPAVHVVGIPVEDQLHGTIISPMPGTDPPMLRETDRAARSALGIALRTAPTH